MLLIIADDQAFAQLLLDRARAKGFRGIVGGIGEEGFLLAQQYKPAAITLDIRLPGADGWSVLDRIKFTPEMRHIPVQVISAGQDHERAILSGAFASVAKPASGEGLDDALVQIKEFIGKGSRRLLVVEEDATERKAIEELVGGGDITVTAVGTTAEARAALEGGPFDCMVLDLGQTDSGGIEFVEAVRDDHRLTDMPVVVYTGRTLDKPDKDRLSRLAQRVIVKTEDSQEKLLDETALFLHRVVATLPEAKRRMIEKLYHRDGVLTDKKVLIVDDDVRNIFALTSLLEQHSLRVIHAETGEQALEALQANPGVNAVLMDIMMPEMDGYDTTRAIRRLPQFKALPIIALTAKAMKGDREKCIASGCSDYMTKPVNSPQLLSLLRVWMQN